MSEKEGLQASIDFTKYLLTLAGGAVAFIIQPQSLAQTGWLRALSFAALISLVISVMSGLLVFMRVCTMLARKDYRIDEDRIRFWGQTNVISFGIGFLLIAIGIGYKMYLGPVPVMPSSS